MFSDFLGSWWAMTSAYFGSPANLGGGLVVPSIIAILGMLVFAIGLVWLVATREKQLIWLLPPTLLALLSPVILGLSRAVMTWVGMLFALLVGIIMLLIWTGMIANNAERRLPVWLYGLGLVSFAVYCGFVSIIVVWSGG